MKEAIAILDFGSQYTQLIARWVRHAKVYCKIYPYSTEVETLKRDKVTGIILSGGPASVFAEKAPRPDVRIFDLGIPVLGICYGLQLMGAMLGGEVAKSESREYGHGTLRFKQESRLFDGISRGEIRVWNSHGDRMIRLPLGFKAIGVTENSEFAAIESESQRLYGLQFHPEVSHTEGGSDILKNFLYKICGCKGDWVLEEFIKIKTEEIRTTVGNAHVILGLSGGVDSSVAAALIHQAIGDQLTCVFVDNGLLRKGEREEVEELFRGHFNMDLKVIDARARFLKALKGVNDPEQKRKIIGREFVFVFEETVKGMKEVEFLAQGTLYPDVIESVPINGSPATLIKTHHNVGGLPEEMNLKLMEPLRELFKDEVRELGEKLGLPHKLLWRHPFPGPGLGVRVMGDIREEYLEILRNADAILIEEMREGGYYDEVWQAFCVFLPIRTVGVMGDERTYDYVIAVRIVESEDAMTADWARLPHEFLQKVSNRIINEVKRVNRVVLDISSKPPSTIEWE